ncbi:MAG TPA: hypothetical protein VHE10_03290 [Candidatus Paceibacterota bacterium]|nr:hypothetical protein [Candidatus Paceibacterota bacterium]
MKNTRQIVIYGMDDDSHRMLGRSLGRGSEYDTTRLIENESCLGSRRDVWKATDIGIGRLEEIVRSARKKRYKVAIAVRNGNGPYREHIVPEDEPVAEERKPSEASRAEASRLLKKAGRIKARKQVAISSK